jgi:uncharacterized protein (DUF58 family)
VGALAVGLAAVNTGNNLLFLLLGAMLGLMALSGWLSERVIRNLTVERRLPHGVSAGREARLVYRVTNHKRRFPSLAIELEDEGLPVRTFVARLAPGGTVEAVAAFTSERRGVRRLTAVTISTTFPFGFFRKAGDLTLPGELVIWPRTDRPIQRPLVGAGLGPAGGQTLRALAGPRGEYRGLREYRVGDDPKDIHWRTSAGRETPLVREYDRDAARTLWICLDRNGEPGDDAEEMVEAAASLAARAAGEGRRFALLAGDLVLRPGTGAVHLESALDILARVEFDPTAPSPSPPTEPESCILVSVHGHGAERFGDAIVGTVRIHGEVP